MTPQAEAEKILASYYGDAAVSTAVDPVDIARRMGVNVWNVRMPNNESGIIAKLSPDADVEIFLNSEHAPVRQRFTCAHELGHYIRHLQDHGADTPFYYKRDDRSRCGVYDEEVFANQFAAELLMPRPLMESLVDAGTSRYEISNRLGVSLDAVGHRLTNLRLKTVF